MRREKDVRNMEDYMDCLVQESEKRNRSEWSVFNFGKDKNTLY
jgi:hypothetical protein